MSKEKARDILKQKLAVVALDESGEVVVSAGVQTPKVLDELFRYDGPLGATFAGKQPTLRLWAPTARTVRLHLFNDSQPDTQAEVLSMNADAHGVWSVTGSADWNRKYYLYEVEVYVPSADAFVTNHVTDPYSLSLSVDSRRSQIVNLADSDLQPRGWHKLNKPALESPEDISLYELHVRDFSVSDRSAKPSHRGKFLAFTHSRSKGMRHLRALQKAGLTHVHLLPAFDCATIPESPTTQLKAQDLSSYAPDSHHQYEAIEEIRSSDAFNWCYDPYHYTVPEGSYATQPDGPTRILEFRQMISRLNRTGLRVVMDVVYNHTTASGQSDTSVLDKIVPGYYHRLNANGQVETSTCCANTATEHHMMEKLMLDSLLVWARDYKVDGFRFDLMGHHSKQTLLKARDLLQALTLANDGVDGQAIYLYGEGWNFGEIANDARFVQATQKHMGNDTGIGTFNDRMRDAIRGGWPFDVGDEHVRRQGFANGLYVDPNALNDASDDERTELLEITDWIRAGLAGNLKTFQFTDHKGRMINAGSIDYRGQPAAYASDPQESINYVAAHDNETLFDIHQYKLPLNTSSADRVRAQNLATSLVLFAQGIPFIHAGQELLRSKSMDRNSYDSGDWFNRLDFSYQDNGWASGLPLPEENKVNWAHIAERFNNPTSRVDTRDIRAARDHLTELLRIRNSSPLFRLTNASDIQRALKFHNTGPEQTPGLIVMSLTDRQEPISLVVLFNANPLPVEFALSEPIAGNFALHHVQKRSADRVVRRARFDQSMRRFSVPGRTTAVFVHKR